MSTINRVPSRRESHFSLASMILAAAVLLVGVRGADAQAPIEKANLNCDPLSGIEAIVDASEASFLIIGGLYGTNELPAAVGQVVCHLLVSDRRVLVGIDFPETASAAFARYVSSPGSVADRRDFIRDSGWQKLAEREPDGRTSVAMIRLVEYLRDLRGMGFEVGLLPMQPEIELRHVSETQLEYSYADTLMSAAMTFKADIVVALVTSVSARKRRIDSLGLGSFEPMAMHLPRNTTLTLHGVFTGGEVWGCRDYSYSNCDVTDIVGTSDGEPIRVYIGDTQRGYYDGLLALGKASASPPASGFEVTGK